MATVGTKRLIQTFCWLPLIKHIAFSQYDLALLLLFFCLIYFFVICQLEIEILNSNQFFPGDQICRKSVFDSPLEGALVWLNA